VFDSKQYRSTIKALISCNAVFIDVNLAAKTARELIPWLIAKVLFRGLIISSVLLRGLEL
jgi:hypothetical protein